jgi:hypothetical protein
MRDTEDSIIHQYAMEFKAFDIDLTIDDIAIEYVAELAENKKTGARALVSTWENILTDFQFELPGSNFKDLQVNEELCKAPKDALLEMLKRSPFLDFIEGFKREYGIQLVMDNHVEKYVENYAKERNIQISDALKQLMKGASSLNYMNQKGKFKVTTRMLEDPKYFDTLFTRWFQKTHKERKNDKMPQPEAFAIPGENNQQDGPGDQEGPELDVDNADNAEDVENTENAGNTAGVANVENAENTENTGNAEDVEDVEK